MTPGRERTLAVAFCALGSVLVLFASSQRWAQAVVTDPGFPRVVVNGAGRSVAPATAGLGLVGLAGAVALLATRRVGRIITGGLLVVGGLIVVVQSWVVARDPGTALQDAVATAVGRTGAVPSSVQGSAWSSVAMLGGVLIVVGGGLAVVRGSRWPQLSRRYETGTSEPPSVVADTDEQSDAMWKALDRGEDPTDGPYRS